VGEIGDRCEVWLGWGGMFDLRSPDFFPLLDFFAVAAAALGVPRPGEGGDFRRRAG